MRQARQPDPQQQQIEQASVQLQLQTAQAQLENLQAQTAEIATRIQQNQVETQLLPIEEETKRIAAMAKTMPMDDFEKLVEYAKLELKEKELDTKEDMVRLQMSKSN
jgi:multidrug resistance efflux pump